VTWLHQPSAPQTRGSRTRVLKSRRVGWDHPGLTQPEGHVDRAGVSWLTQPGTPATDGSAAPGKGADHPRFSGAEGEAARPLSRGRQPTTESGESAAESSAVTLKAWTTRVGGGRSSSTTSGIPPASSAGRHRRQPLGERPVVARARARPVGNLAGGRRARPRQLGRADFTSAPTRSLLGWVVGSESRSRVIASSETRCGTRYERRPESRTFR
jgi:hypothetical protein